MDLFTRYRMFQKFGTEVKRDKKIYIGWRDSGLEINIQRVMGFCMTPTATTK